MLKKILIGLAVLIIALLLIGFLLPGKMEVTRSTVINASAEAVFDEFNDLKKWQEWQYWSTLDKPGEATITYGEKSAGTGASYTWDGKNTGKGTITITESIPNKSVASDIEFTGSGTAKGLYTVEPEGEGTKATMNFSFDNGMNPIGRWFSVFMKGEIERAFDYGLARIKERAEAKPKFTEEITETTTAAINYVGIPSGTLSTEDEAAMNAQMGKAFGQLMNDLTKAKVQVTGAAFCLYTKWDEAAKQMEMVCALPVDEKAKVPAKYKIQQIPAGKAVKAVHHGDYRGLETTHMELNKYIELKKLTMAGAPWEMYITDPMVEKDTAAWVTEVYYPIQ
ncbi:MAG TPA: SRPBCC family protein [Cyclobacteriaceae bacterium]|nr:SRPBCC family protein [Cyclobacteriaceae bacterium]HMV10918.1 SRPBCC family protein [Cyclobacteriaceae bacterium]HMV89778.1 SRPBCC family protein [Cyclobacteriaceae bacterium]HMX02391.1 SRPBCC family protein [Cyclobacteriaceae bacterium]HMX52134.1 SRPBCC family protein [Cyclobacteriaceae bacterium]